MRTLDDLLDDVEKDPEYKPETMGRDMAFMRWFVEAIKKEIEEVEGG